MGGNDAPFDPISHEDRAAIFRASISKFIFLLALVFAACGPDTPPQRFTDVTQQLGIAFEHEAGEDGTFFLPQIMGAGVALLDYDLDGDLDLYFVNGGVRGADKTEDIGPNRLYRQDADGRFTDVTKGSGLGDRGYGMGVAVGDVDNDGDSDLLVTNYGPDKLYRNNGDGTFADVTEAAGITNSRWSASATFFDYDADGWLDLFIANYLAYEPQIIWYRADGRLVYCAPDSYFGEIDKLYRNQGDGTFRDVTLQVGLGETPGKGLGVVAADFTGDGRVDIYVANDGEPNFLWTNQGDGTFVDEAMMRGLAVNLDGKSEASMGIARGDADGDGDLDLFLTHMDHETNTFYRNDAGQFADATEAANLSKPSLQRTGFGTAFLDIDHDGDLDLVSVNGRVGSKDIEPSKVARANLRLNPSPRTPEGKPVQLGRAPEPGAESPFSRLYGQHDQLFENVGEGRFVDAASRGGALTAGEDVGRGLAVGDLDGDGDLDLVVNNVDARPHVLRNDVPKQGQWLLVRASDPSLRRDAVGALVTVGACGRSFTRLIGANHSYLSSSDARAHFGLGTCEAVEEIEVRWPSGDIERFGGGPSGRFVVVERGTGQRIREATEPSEK